MVLAPHILDYVERGKLAGQRVKLGLNGGSAVGEESLAAFVKAVSEV